MQLPTWWVRGIVWRNWTKNKTDVSWYRELCEWAYRGHKLKAHRNYISTKELSLNLLEIGTGIGKLTIENFIILNGYFSHKNP